MAPMKELLALLCLLALIAAAPFARAQCTPPSCPEQSPPACGQWQLLDSCGNFQWVSCGDPCTLLGGFCPGGSNASCITSDCTFGPCTTNYTPHTGQVGATFTGGCYGGWCYPCSLTSSACPTGQCGLFTDTGGCQITCDATHCSPGTTCSNYEWPAHACTVDPPAGPVDAPAMTHSANAGLVAVLGLLGVCLVGVGRRRHHD